MSLGKDELVVVPHDPMVQGQQQFERRKVASNVTHATVEVHLEQPQPCFSQEVLQGDSPLPARFTQ
jgi:hypothetical protein